MKSLLEKANILAEALPYIHKLAGKTVVVKYGGNAMTDEEVTKTILEDIALLKIVGVNPILVHGGGPEINAMLKRLEIKSEFHNGYRVTDAQTMEVVQMILCGKLNKNITSKLNVLGVSAIGLCGKDANLIRAEKSKASDGFDLGYVGEVKSINTKLLDLIVKDYVPVVASVGTDREGNSYNINADIAASEIAVALKAEKLIFLTDIDGIRRDEKDPKSLISEITVSEINQLISDEIITGGMIPKVTGCISCIERGIKRAHIINGTMKHPIMLEIFTDSGIGTMIKN